MNSPCLASKQFCQPSPWQLSDNVAIEEHAQDDALIILRPGEGPPLVSVSAVASRHVHYCHRQVHSHGVHIGEPKKSYNITLGLRFKTLLNLPRKTKICLFPMN